MGEWDLKEERVITIEEFDKAIATLAELREDHAIKKAVSDAAKKHVDEQEYLIMELLKASNRLSYASALGTATLSTRYSYKTPKLREDKEKFFKWLEEAHGEDTMWAYMGVNSQSLNSLCKTELEMARLKGEEFSPAGLEEPTPSETLSFRKK